MNRELVVHGEDVNYCMCTVQIMLDLDSSIVGLEVELVPSWAG